MLSAYPVNSRIMTWANIEWGKWGRAYRCLLGIALVLAIAVIIACFLPRRYLATVIMEVKPDQSGHVVAILSESRGARFDPEFVAAQIQRIQTAEILDEVIARLDLVKVFSGYGRRLREDEVLARLRSSMSLRAIHETGLIELGVYSPNRKNAADLANTIADVYRSKRAEERRRLREDGLAQFQAEVSKQRKMVEEAAIEAAQIRERDSIVDPDPETQYSPLQQSGSPFSLEDAVKEQRRKVTELRTLMLRTQAFKAEEQASENPE
jgi:uncharacterized protein involved in exopolysaccharide biosynthesis